jgi:hypothetical protein
MKTYKEKGQNGKERTGEEENFEEEYEVKVETNRRIRRLWWRRMRIGQGEEVNEKKGWRKRRTGKIGKGNSRGG